MSLAESLDEALMGDAPDLDSEPEAPLDVEQADRFLYALGVLDDRMEQVARLAHSRLLQIEEWEQAEAQKIANKRAWYVQALELFHRNRLAQDAKAKTISLPHGRLVSRSQQPEWQFEREVFTDWALHNGHRECVRIPEPPPEPDVAAIKKGFVLRDGRAHDRVTGEVVPGLIVVTRERKFTVETGR